MAASNRRLQGASILAMIADVFGAFALVCYTLILGPLGVLRGPIVLERTVWYLWVLVPQGLLARSLRTALDWRLGNFDAAVSQLETIVSLNEEYYKARTDSRMRKRVLEDLYVVLTRAYLHSGGIDDAMLVVIRAKKCMGIERLGGLAKIDAKTAHLVRAGLAAGRLLDGGGLATMFVKTSHNEGKAVTSPVKQPPQRPPEPPRRQGATKEASEPILHGAKVIPFPQIETDGP